MKRTQALIKIDGSVNFKKMITCEVIGELENGTKVWKRIDKVEDDINYILVKGKYGLFYFSYI